MNFDLFQVIYLTALLFRSFNGEYLKNEELAQTFIDLYDQNLAKMISEIYPCSIIEAMKEKVNLMGVIKINLERLENKNKQLSTIVESWIEPALIDCEKIFSNKYMCLEALLRLLECFKSTASVNPEVKWSDAIMSPELSACPKRTKEQMSREKINIRIIKKI